MLVFSQADTIIIGHLLDMANVGIYRITLQFTMVSNLILQANFVDTNSPTLTITYSLVLAIPVFVGGVLLGDRLLLLFYGADFARGYKTLIILLAVQVINIFQFLFTMYLDALDNPKESFKITAVGVVANIVLNIILIPVMGVSGAAIAILATMTINSLLARRTLSKLIKIRIEQHSLLNILIASTAMGALVGGYRLLIPLSNIWVTLVAVTISVTAYGVFLC